MPSGKWIEDYNDILLEIEFEDHLDMTTDYKDVQFSVCFNPSKHTLKEHHKWKDIEWSFAGARYASKS